jgi:rRNA-processing protein EBP2
MEDEEEVGSEADDELTIEAVARQLLKPGERVLTGKKSAKSPVGVERVKTVNNVEDLQKKKAELEYRVPTGLKRVPWSETFALTTPEIRDFGDEDVAREKAFHDATHEAVKEGYRRLKSLGIPASRPGDFLAEMLKTDSQMFKVRAHLAEADKRIKKFEDRKQKQLDKKFNKKSQVAKKKKKDEQKKDNMMQVNNWKKNANENDSILDGKKLGREKSSVKKKIAKQAAKDKKFGFGGKKGGKYGSKANNAASAKDMSGYKSSVNSNRNGGGSKKGGGKGSKKGKKR